MVTPRWGLAGFAGIGKAADGFDALQECGDRGGTPAAGSATSPPREFGLQMGVDARTGPEEWAIYVVFGNSCSDAVAMTRDGKFPLFLLRRSRDSRGPPRGAGLPRPRLVNTKAFRRPRAVGARAQDRVTLSYARAEVTLFPRPRVVIHGVVLDVPGLAAGTVKTLQRTWN